MLDVAKHPSLLRGQVSLAAETFLEAGPYANLGQLRLVESSYVQVHLKQAESSVGQI